MNVRSMGGGGGLRRLHDDDLQSRPGRRRPPLRERPEDETEADADVDDDADDDVNVNVDRRRHPHLQRCVGRNEQQRLLLPSAAVETSASTSDVDADLDDQLDMLRHNSGGARRSSLLDLLPHLTEINGGGGSGDSAVANAQRLPKTYTEPSNLNGLLRQVGSRLFAQPPRSVRRSIRVSPVIADSAVGCCNVAATTDDLAETSPSTSGDPSVEVVGSAGQLDPDTGSRPCCDRVQRSGGVSRGAPTFVAGAVATDRRPCQRRESLVSMELGLFCDQCSDCDGNDQRHQHQHQNQQQQQPRRCREQGIQVNSVSMASISSTSSLGGPVCRICHSPGDKLDPLISPCRCSGTLKYVHSPCLLRWLEISSRKLRRPPHCELCGYSYRRHKRIRLRHIQWPACSRRDKIFHILFLASVLTMIGCAAVTVICFKTDRVHQKRTDDSISLKKTSSTNTAASANHVELSGQEVVTLVCGILFFSAFFVAMYLQVKAQTTIYKLLMKLWFMNQVWRVDEYRKERDARYWRQRQQQQQQQQQQKQKQTSKQCVANVHSSPRHVLVVTPQPSTFHSTET